VDFITRQLDVHLEQVFRQRHLLRSVNNAHCVPQRNQLWLDAIADRLMFRNAHIAGSLAVMNRCLILHREANAVAESLV